MATPGESPLTLAPADRAYDLCGVGTALVDHLSFADLGVVAELGLEPGAMTLIDSPTATRIRARLGEGREVSGGTVANTVAGVASLGGRPVYIGAVAEDDLGARYASDLESSGVRAVLQRQTSDEEGTGTGACYVIVTPDRQRTMATNLGVAGLLTHDAITEDVIGASSLVYFDGYLLDFPDATHLVRRIVDLARRSGTAIALGLADPFVVERHSERLRELVGLVDVVFSNADEATALTGAPDIDHAVRALLATTPVAIVTRGPLGAMLGDRDGVVEVPAVPVAEVVDVTGAGDLFAAGVGYGLTHGLTLSQCGHLGALCAAEAISHLGARPETSLAALDPMA